MLKMDIHTILLNRFNRFILSHKPVKPLVHRNHHGNEKAVCCFAWLTSCDVAFIWHNTSLQGLTQYFRQASHLTFTFFSLTTVDQ